MPFGQHLVPNNLQNEPRMTSKRDPKMTMENMENCALAKARAHFRLLMRDPKKILFWSLSSEPSGDPSWEPLRRIIGSKGTPKISKSGSKMRPPFWDHFWSRAGGRGRPTRESKASQDKDQISTVPIKKHARSSLNGRRQIQWLRPCRRPLVSMLCAIISQCWLQVESEA